MFSFKIHRTHIIYRRISSKRIVKNDVIYDFGPGIVSDYKTIMIQSLKFQTPEKMFSRWSSSAAEFHRCAPTEPYVSLSTHTALHVHRKLPGLYKLLVSPITGWLTIYFGHVSPFAPFPLQKLPHYYELIRPCASRQYSFPSDFLVIEATGSHVPCKSLKQDHTASTEVRDNWGA